jgi:hypothetical protein
VVASEVVLSRKVSSVLFLNLGSFMSTHGHVPFGKALAFKLVLV